MKWRIFEGNKILKEIWRIFWQCEGNLKEILIKPAPLKNFICNITVADAIQTKEVKHQSTMARLLANDNKNNPQATTKLLLESQPSCIACVLMLLWNDKRQKRSLLKLISIYCFYFLCQDQVLITKRESYWNVQQISNSWTEAELFLNVSIYLEIKCVGWLWQLFWMYWELNCKFGIFWWFCQIYRLCFSHSWLHVCVTAGENYM